MLRSIAIKTVSFAATVLLAQGCHDQAAVVHGDDFAPDNQTTAIAQLDEAQATRGAGADATLYACHFDGTELNSLGTTKLNRMLRDNGAGSMAVWMAVAEDDKAPARRMSVAAYLQDHGLPPEQVAFGRGPNPATSHLAAQSIKELTKTETATGAASAGGDASGASAATSH